MLSFIKNLFSPSTDFKTLVNEGAVIIDVRTKAEYEAGHIKGSKNIPLNSIESRIAEIKKYGKPVVTVCRSGSRSAMAKGILQGNGIQAYNGGSWIILKTFLTKTT